MDIDDNCVGIDTRRLISKGLDDIYGSIVTYAFKAVQQYFNVGDVDNMVKYADIYDMKFPLVEHTVYGKQLESVQASKCIAYWRKQLAEKQAPASSGPGTLTLTKPEPRGIDTIDEGDEEGDEDQEVDSKPIDRADSGKGKGALSYCPPSTYRMPRR
jgi:hypothetical protein